MNTTPAQVASWIEISRSAVADNICAYKNLLAQGAKESPGARFGVVLKGNAYGHGFLEMYSLVHNLVDVVFLINPQDAVMARSWESLQGHGPCRLVVLGAVAPDECVALSKLGVEVVVGDRSWMTGSQALADRLESSLKCHIHLDTGLGREGFSGQDLEALLNKVTPHADKLQIVGVLSHFANTEDVTAQDYALAQVAAFERDSAFIENKIQIPQGTLERHFAATAATLVLPQARFQTVRVGIGLYGLWPSPETKISTRVLQAEPLRLRPVLSWRSPIQHTKTLGAGSFVGYGCTHRCGRETRIAVCPVGYFDGYPRLVSHKAYVLVEGQRCPVLGRVMMNHIIVDVSGVDVLPDGAVVTLVGESGAEKITIEQVAGWADTIHYEVCARLGSHLKRMVVP